METDLTRQIDGIWYYREDLLEALVELTERQRDEIDRLNDEIEALL